jgi:membrane protease YdiL (CAAX protease family)
MAPGVPPFHFDLGASLLTVLFIALHFAAWIAILVVGVMRWSEIRPSLRTGAILAAIAFVLSVPWTVITAFYLDLSKMIPAEVRRLAPVLQAIVSVNAAFSLLTTAAHTVLKVGVAGLVAREGRPPFPLLSRAGAVFRGWPIAAVAGLACGALSVFAFAWLDVKPGDVFRFMDATMPGLQTMPKPWLFLAFLPTLLAAAVSEEILFRGVIQPWLARLFGETTPGLVLAMALTSAMWAIAHAMNATPLVPKLVQVFLLGFVLGGIARRYSVEASIVAHGVLNVTAVLLPLLRT